MGVDEAYESSGGLFVDVALELDFIDSVLCEVCASDVALC